MGILAGYPKFQALNDSGNPLSGGLLYTYSAGTSTLKTTYSDKAETTPNTNPIVLDSNGETTIFLGDGDYKFVLNEPNDDPPETPDDIRWTQDDVQSINFSTETIYKTEDYSLVSSDMDGTKTFGTKGASTGTTLTLPNGGDNYAATFINSESQELIIQASGTELIRIGDSVTSAGGKLKLSAQGGSVSLRWDGYAYVVTNLVGTLLYSTSDTVYAKYGFQNSPGIVFYYAGEDPPDGSLVRDGSAVSRTVYADLWDALSIYDETLEEIVGMYGNGDGSTTFNLPDDQGMGIKAVDNGSGVDLDAATRTDRGDGVTGDNVGTKQGFSTALPIVDFGTAGGNHNHSSTSGGSVSVTYGEGSLTSVSDYASGTTTSGTGAHSHTITGGDNQTTGENIYYLPCIYY